MTMIGNKELWCDVSDVKIYQLSTLKYSEILILVRYSSYFVISSQQFFQLLSTLLTSLNVLNLLTSSHYSKHFSPLLSSPLLTVSQIFVPLLSASQLVTSLNTPHPVTTFWTFLNALLNALLYSSHLCSLLVPWSTLLASSKFVSHLFNPPLLASSHLFSTQLTQYEVELTSLHL